ncbi:hypothetical protein ELX74_21575 [Escherichia coli]|nr:hypothetical protein B7980_27175 [Escherichia coli]OYK78983.1 hypothetical protein CI719_00750 [Shigella boydii]TFL46082.1 hypothetical protein ELY35_29950 [Escherichia coli]TFL56129.1 hypothetical protein ELY35_20980 [Escherichia coli]TFN43497.1 hypothetical protein ELX74_27315 [Escherichia coli]
MHPQFLVWCLTFGAQFNIDGRDCCQTGQPSQDVTDGALTTIPSDRARHRRSRLACPRVNGKILRTSATVPSE